MTDNTRYNWSYEDPGDYFPEGFVVTHGNFAQLYPDTPIMVDLPLVIRGGNWTNVRKDPAWQIECKGFNQVPRCTNEHPELLALGHLPCDIECDHLESTEEVWDGGVLKKTIQHYRERAI